LGGEGTVEIKDDKKTKRMEILRKLEEMKNNRHQQRGRKETKIRGKGRIQ
jgi:hypothetical protein